MSRLLAASALVFLAVATPAASAVRHNRITMSAVGPLRLGMNQAAEKKALRQLRPNSFRSYQDTNVKGDLIYREYSYYRGYGLDSYHIGFLGQKGHPHTFRVARIITYVAGDRTAPGAHVGMSEDAVRRMYRGALHCGQTIDRRVTTYEPCRVGAANRRRIVILLSKYFTDAVFKVDRIAVQEPGLKAPIVQ